MSFDRTKFLKIIAMTASNHDGEVVNAARLANAMLAEAKLSWADVVGKASYREVYRPQPPGGAPPDWGSTDMAAAFRYAAEAARAADERKSERQEYYRSRGEQMREQMRRRQAERDRGGETFYYRPKNKEHPQDDPFVFWAGPGDPDPFEEAVGAAVDELKAKAGRQRSNSTMELGLVIQMMSQLVMEGQSGNTDLFREFGLAHFKEAEWIFRNRHQNVFAHSTLKHICDGHPMEDATLDLIRQNIKWRGSRL